MTSVNGCIIFFSLIWLCGCGTVQPQIKEETIYKDYNNYGLRCLELGLVNEAKLYLEKALRLNPQSATINNNIAILYESLNLKDFAKTHYLQAINLDSQKKVYQENFLNFTEKLLEEKAELPIRLLPLEPKEQISLRKIQIKRQISSSIDTTNLNQVIVLAVTDDPEDKSVGLAIAKIFGEMVGAVSQFYLIKGYELNKIAEGEPLNWEGIKKAQRRVELCESTGADAIVVIHIHTYQENISNDYNLKGVYSIEKGRYIYYNEYSTVKVINIDCSFSFFEGGNSSQLLWEKEHSASETAVYSTEDESFIPKCDIPLLTRLVKVPIDNFITAITSKVEYYPRWAALLK